MFDPDRISAEHAPIGEVLDEATARIGKLPFGTPRFDSVFPADLDEDGEIELHRFSKPPLEAVIADRVPGWRIWHPHDDAECCADEGLRRALMDASDHFPVSADLEIERAAGVRLLV